MSERRQQLEELLSAADAPKLVFSRGFEGDGADVFKAVEQLGLEGSSASAPTACTGAARAADG